MVPFLLKSFFGFFFFDFISLIFSILRLVVFSISLLSFFSSNLFSGLRKFSSKFLILIIYFVIIRFLVSSYIIFYLFLELIFLIIFFSLIKSGTKIEREISAYYMFFFTLASSLPLIIFIIISISNFKIHTLYIYHTWSGFWWMFIFIVFFVKVPVFGVHIWLPKAHVEAPLPGSVVLSGILLKIGFYGIFRFINFSKFFINNWFSIFISLGWMGGLVITLVCLRQIDVKSIIAYSSVVHMGVGLSGCLRDNFTSVISSLFIRFAHGLSSPIMFYVLYIIYNKENTRRILLIKGRRFKNPLIGYIILIVMVSSIGLPPMISFFSEFISNIGVIFHRQRFILVSMILFFSTGVYLIYFFVYFFHGVNLHSRLNQADRSDLILIIFLPVNLIMYPVLLKRII